MLDLKEELGKYKPVLSIEDVEKAIKTDEIKDIMDLLSHITKQISSEE